MKLTVSAATVLMCASLLALSSARADERDEKHEQGEQRPMREGQRQQKGPQQKGPQQKGPQQNGPQRGPPPKFEAHPPGMHPQGATVHSHPVRVLAPKMVTRRGGGWSHWEHPDFDRPVYFWNWRVLHNVTCVAEDSYGDQYPVTEAVWRTFNISDMTNVEDDALDRCYAESGQDESCYLVTCNHS